MVITRISNDTKALQSITVSEEGMKEYLMKINVKKAKVMRLKSHTEHESYSKEKISVTVEKPKYLGCLLTAEWTSEIKAMTRISVTKETFNNKNTFCSGGDGGEQAQTDTFAGTIRSTILPALWR